MYEKTRAVVSDGSAAPDSPGTDALSAGYYDAYYLRAQKGAP